MAGVHEEVSSQSSHAILEIPPPDMVEEMSTYFEAAHVLLDNSSETAHSMTTDHNALESDSGDSLFITQVPVPEAARSEKRSHKRIWPEATSPSEDEESGIEGAVSQAGNSSSVLTSKRGRQMKKRGVKLFRLPFLEMNHEDIKLPRWKGVRRGICLSNQQNARLKAFSLGGFFKCTKLWSRFNKEDIPNIYMDVQETLSEETEASDDDGGIKVVGNELLAKSVKAKCPQRWATSASPQWENCIEVKTVKRPQSERTNKVSGAGSLSPPLETSDRSHPVSPGESALGAESTRPESNRIVDWHALEVTEFDKETPGLLQHTSPEPGEEMGSENGTESVPHCPESGSIDLCQPEDGNSRKVSSEPLSEQGNIEQHDVRSDRASSCPESCKSLYLSNGGQRKEKKKGRMVRENGEVADQSPPCVANVNSDGEREGKSKKRKKEKHIVTEEKEVSLDVLCPDSDTAVIAERISKSNVDNNNIAHGLECSLAQLEDQMKPRKKAKKKKRTSSNVDGEVGEEEVNESTIFSNNTRNLTENAVVFKKKKKVNSIMVESKTNPEAEHTGKSGNQFECSADQEVECSVEKTKKMTKTSPCEHSENTSIESSGLMSARKKKRKHSHSFPVADTVENYSKTNPAANPTSVGSVVCSDSSRQNVKKGRVSACDVDTDPVENGETQMESPTGSNDVVRAEKKRKKKGLRESAVEVNRRCESIGLDTSSCAETSHSGKKKKKKCMENDKESVEVERENPVDFEHPQAAEMVVFKKKRDKCKRKNFPHFQESEACVESEVSTLTDHVTVSPKKKRKRFSLEADAENTQDHNATMSNASSTSDNIVKKRKKKGLRESAVEVNRRCESIGLDTSSCAETSHSGKKKKKKCMENDKESVEVERENPVDFEHPQAAEMVVFKKKRDKCKRKNFPHFQESEACVESEVSTLTDHVTVSPKKKRKRFSLEADAENTQDHNATMSNASSTSDNIVKKNVKRKEKNKNMTHDILPEQGIMPEYTENESKKKKKKKKRKKE